MQICNLKLILSNDTRLFKKSTSKFDKVFCCCLLWLWEKLWSIPVWNFAPDFPSDRSCCRVWSSKLVGIAILILFYCENEWLPSRCLYQPNADIRTMNWLIEVIFMVFWYELWRSFHSLDFYSIFNQKWCMNPAIPRLDALEMSNFHSSHGK